MTSPRDSALKKRTRKATKADIPCLHALQKSVEIEDAIWGYRADSLECWEKRDLAWTFMAFAEDQPAGFIYCTERAHDGECIFPVGSRILEIVDLMIAPDFRRFRHGHDLVEAVQNQARVKGITHLQVYSAAKRFDDIVRFYRSCGFGPWYMVMTQEIGQTMKQGG